MKRTQLKQSPELRAQTSNDLSSLYSKSNLRFASAPDLPMFVYLSDRREKKIECQIYY